MGQKSKVEQLPADILDLVTGLIRAGKTYREISLKLWELVEDGKLHSEGVPSRSSLSRYKRRGDLLAEKVRRSREIAEVAVARFGQEPESKIARMNIELLHGVLMDLMVAYEEGRPDGDEDGDVTVQLDPMAMMLLAKSVDHLARAAKQDSDVVLKAREEAAKAAMQAVQKAAKTGSGISPETLDAIEKELNLR